MITIQKLSNVNVGTTSLGKYEISEAGKALAHIPEFKAFFDADFYTDKSMDILNRANGINSRLRSATYTPVVFHNGQRGLSKRISGATYVVTDGDYDINPDAWTFFVVMKPAVSTNEFRLIRAINDTTEPSPHLILSASTRTLGVKPHAINGVSSILYYEAPVGDAMANKPTPQLAIFSFSTKRGTTIRLSGKEVAFSSTLKTPFIAGYKKGEWDWMRNAHADFGAWGGLNIDLTLDENKQYLNDLERYFMNKYEITA
ncbi:hypothetical protein B9T31_12055 [Acinetobacter sp. ANC 4558]|uniref:hypothetical protein n=1 Tax=Acinetobacter sp. ANC 4558 TaxID=1977876 RepID=UPI000A32D666|nr:hypothetical protein [Acinetobacter sp. ANC 4558]OTG85517.1 hypothetical protein B9T31_12055 [Acinetobacter sp. ANC 4558]